MTDQKISAITSSTTAPADTDLLPTVEDVATTPVTKRKAWSVFRNALAASAAQVNAGTATNVFVTPDALTSGFVYRVRGTVVDPQTVYTKRAQLVLFRADAALTITRIYIDCNDHTPTSEMAGDLKWANDIADGSFASAAVIDVCDTTNGVFTATSGMDDATIPSGKFVYYQFDASPHADIDEFYIEVYYQYD